ncbi:Secreted metalloprotease [Bacillus cereus Rock4-18]|nr:Secreted metalloprotease [Bacillus cereus Rock4-18]
MRIYAFLSLIAAWGFHYSKYMDTHKNTKAKKESRYLLS